LNHLSGQRHKQSGDLGFFLVMGGISASFIVLIVLLLIADLLYTSVDDFWTAVRKPEVQAAFRLTVIT